MASQVHCESYLPGYSLMRISTEDSSSSWSSYQEHKTLNEHFYHPFTLSPASEFSGYDKEMLKRTVLEHEAIFRKQVCELHRLYRTQKDLMDELKKKELYRLPVQSGILRPLFFPSAMASEATDKCWGLPLFDKSVVASDADIKPSLEVLKGKYMQFSQIPRKNGVSLNNGEFSNSKPQSCPKQLLDLQLRADVCIDDDDDFGGIQKDDMFNPFWRVRDNSSIICDIENENDVKLTLGTREDCRRGSWNPHPTWQNNPSMQSIDLMNGFKTGLSCKGQSGSDSNNFLYGDQSAMRSSRNSMLPDCFRDKHRDGGTCLNYFDVDKGKARQEWPSFSYGDGISGNGANSFNLCLSSEKSPMPSETSEQKRKRTHNIPSHNHGEMQTLFEEKPSLGSECYQKGTQFANPYQVPGPFLIFPSSEDASRASPMASSRRKPPKIITHIPIAVQALPCFPATEIAKSRSRKPKRCIQDTTVQNGSQQDLWFDFDSTKQVKTDSDSSVYENPESYASPECPESEKVVPFIMPLTNSTGEDKNFVKLSKGCSEILGFPICTPLANDNELERKNEVGEISKVTERGINIDLNTLEITAEDEDIDLEIPVPSYETPDTLAAENLVLMSQDPTQRLHPASCDSLLWFADVISSKADIPDYPGGNDVDLFETLTLELEEMKQDEYLPPCQKDENCSGIKPCKGRTRKRRQKKDFQKDVLPGLVTLSRHQMTEDLHAFDCLMRAMGEAWESKFTRRNASRKGLRSSPPMQPITTAHSKVEIDERSILGWGRKIRRGWRPRVRPSNACVSLVVS